MRPWWWIVLATACGGRVAQDGDGGPAQAQAIENGADAAAPRPKEGADFPVCPGDPPAVGAACSMPPEQGCAYVVKQPSTWACEAFVCDASGHWTTASGGC